MRVISKIVVLFFFSFFLINKAKGQVNFVLNGSFDTVHINVCDGTKGWYIEQACNPWREFYHNKHYVNKIWHNCRFDGHFFPKDGIYNAVQYPRTGEGVIAMFNTSYWYTPDTMLLWSEYIKGKLSKKLKAGRKYYCGFYVNYPDYMAFICNNLGMAVSQDTFPEIGDIPWDTTGNIYKRLYPIIPQINNPPGRSLFDTVSWTLIADTLLATGGEQYVILGQFDDGNPLDTMHTGFYGNPNGFSPFYDPRSYFMFDDVFVIELDSLVGIREEDIQSYFEKINRELIITIPAPYAMQQLRLTDTQGALVFNKSFNTVGKSRIALPENLSGVYIAEILLNNKSVIRKKIVVER